MKDLFAAIQRGDAATVKSCVHAEPRLASARNEAGISAPLFALYCGKADIANELAQHRSELDLFEAAAFGETARVAELVSQEPRLVNSRSPDGFSPLGFAAFFGSVRVLEFLIARGAEVNAASQNALRVQPLHSAVAQRDPDAALRSAEKLIAAGADVNARQQAGWTPLHAAAARGHLPLVTLLLVHGANRDARNDDGKTALDVAREKNQPEAAKMLGGSLALHPEKNMNGKFVLAVESEKLELDWGSLMWISKPALTGAASLAVCYVEIYPGKGHNFHKHPAQEEVIHVIEGTMEQWLGRERKLLKPKDSVFIPKGTVHASFNTGASTLKLLAVLGPCAGPDGYEIVDVSGEEPWRSIRR